MNPRAFFYNPLTTRNGFPLTITGFNWQDDIDESATNVKFNLPVTSELRIQKTDNYGSELLESINWQVKKLIVDTDPASTIPMNNPVENLVLPLNQKGQFTIINTGRVNPANFTILPDTKQTFENSTDFYRELAKLVNFGDYLNGIESTYSIVMLNAEGQYIGKDFNVNQSMHVIITGDLGVAFRTWLIKFNTVLGGSLIALSHAELLRTVFPYLKEIIANGTLPIDLLGNAMSSLEKFIHSP